MKGFKPTGYGPTPGFSFPRRMGFTGSTGQVTNVVGYTRRKFANGGFVRQDTPRMTEESIGDQGSALVRRARSSTNLDQESGGKTPLRPGFRKGGRCMKSGGKWIQGAIKNPGALHRALNVPAGKAIPAKKLARAANSNDPTMRRRANLAKTLKGMRKADGGPVSRDEAGRHKSQKLAKADGGGVTLPRRKTPYTWSQAIKDTMRAIGSNNTGMAKKAADRISGRQKQIDDYIDSAETGNDRTASNYSRGGKMKRGGYADGGRRDKYIRVFYPKKPGMSQSELEQRRADISDMTARDRTAIEHNLYEYKRADPDMKKIIQQLNDVAFGAPNHVTNFAKTRDFKPKKDPRFARGGAMKRMGYQAGGRRDGLVTEAAPKTVKQAPKSPPKQPTAPASTVKEKFYQTGGISRLMRRAGTDAADMPARGGPMTELMRRMMAARSTAAPARVPPVRPIMRGMMSAGGTAKKYANGGHVRYPAPKGHAGFEHLPMFGKTRRD